MPRVLCLFFQKKWRLTLEIVLYLSLCLSTIIKIEKEKKRARVVSIEIYTSGDKHFLYYPIEVLEKEIKAFLDIGHAREKKHLDALDLYGLSSFLKKNPFFENVTVYTRYPSVLRLIIHPRKFIARVFLSLTKGLFYLDDKGVVYRLPTLLPSHFLLFFIPVEKEQEIIVSKKCPLVTKKTIDFIERLNRDGFFSRQITSFRLTLSEEIFLGTYLGGQTIFWGSYEDIEEKWLKMKLFYTTIIPKVGWNRYHTIMLDVPKQIICK